jgi:hypothetical protein
LVITGVEFHCNLMSDPMGRYGQGPALPLHETLCWAICILSVELASYVF